MQQGSSAKRILIVTQPGAIEFSSYILSRLSSNWKADGHSVQVSSTQEERLNADAVVLHVDLTVVPASYRNFAKQFPVGINVDAASISKDLFSRKSIAEGEHSNGALIIKTKENFGALPERRGRGSTIAQKKLEQILGRFALSKGKQGTLVSSIAWRHLRRLDPNHYPIFASTAAVPAGAWRNPRLIIEEFCPERTREGAFVLRHWYFLGQNEFSRTLISENPIVKWDTMTSSEKQRSRKEWDQITVSTDADIPAEVRKARDELKLGFGRIDWVMCKGEPVVFDVNKTPANVGASNSDPVIEKKIDRIFRDLATGLYDLL